MIDFITILQKHSYENNNKLNFYTTTTHINLNYIVSIEKSDRHNYVYRITLTSGKEIFTDDIPEIKIINN